ncbi:MAG TPA: dihydrofolate reductase family protein [Thermoanaerobaculia bacterium]
MASRKVVLQEFLTLDGMAAGPGGGTDFIPAAMQGDETFSAHQSRFLDSIDLILLGRVTYELFAGYWPNVTEGDEKPFADKLNSIDRVVFSRTLDRAPWGRWKESRIVRTDPATEVRAIKASAGKDIVIWGSLTVARSLMAAGAIDQYQLVYVPAVIGKGTPMFGPATELAGLKLQATESFDRGAVLLTYVPRMPGREGGA